MSAEAPIELGRQVWLGKLSSIASNGLLVMSACVQCDLPLVGPEAASRFDEVIKEDWQCVWDMGSLCGTESWAYQDGFGCDGYALGLLDQQRPIEAMAVELVGQT